MSTKLSYQPAYDASAVLNDLSNICGVSPLTSFSKLDVSFLSRDPPERLSHANSSLSRNSYSGWTFDLTEWFESGWSSLHGIYIDQNHWNMLKNRNTGFPRDRRCNCRRCTPDKWPDLEDLEELLEKSAGNTQIAPKSSQKIAGYSKQENSKTLHGSSPQLLHRATLAARRGCDMPRIQTPPFIYQA